MDRTEIFLEADEKAFSILEKYTEWVLEFMEKSPIPKTSRSMLMLVNKILTIKNAIYDLSESENVYSQCILLRSLIEHFLRFNYIFFNAMESKNDSAGEKFYDTLYVKELHDLAKAYKRLNEGVGKTVKSTIWEIVGDLSEESKKVNPKDVEEVSREFSYVSIINYINERINKDKSLNLLLNMIPAYSDLSSFVHGGRFSDEVIAKMVTDGLTSKRIDNIIETTYTIFTTSLLFMFLLFYQYDKRFGIPYQQIDALIKETFH